jgi:hypothetical protein
MRAVPTACAHRVATSLILVPGVGLEPGPVDLQAMQSYEPSQRAVQIELRRHPRNSKVVPGVGLEPTTTRYSTWCVCQLRHPGVTLKCVVTWQGSWCPRRDSNPQQPASETGTSTNCVTWACIWKNIGADAPPAKNGIGAQGGTRTRKNRHLRPVRLPIAPPGRGKFFRAKRSRKPPSRLVFSNGRAKRKPPTAGPKGAFWKRADLSRRHPRHDPPVLREAGGAKCVAGCGWCSSGADCGDASARRQALFSNLAFRHSSGTSASTSFASRNSDSCQPR